MKLENPLIKFNLEKQSSDLLIKAFKSFLNESLVYRTQFLQCKYNKAFDGYSYLGQNDSINQYDYDLLHSFVLSEFTPVNNFPKEFQTYLTTEFLRLSTQIKALEIQYLKAHNLDELVAVYELHFGHMISCNYYPKVEAFQNNKIEQRLSSHKDVSLFSIFPYGLAEGLASKDESGKVLEIGNQQDCFGFNGYGLEYFTKDEFKAFNHFVELPKNQKKERFSVAYFSIPKPNAIFTLNGKTYHAETFYQDYLNLF